MSTCYSSIDFCMARLVDLDADGAPLPGADTLYVTDIPISAAVGFVVAAGDSLELKNGCGAICATFEDCDRIKAATLNLNLCQLEAELIIKLTGALPITVGGEIVGFEVAPPDASCANGVGVELWSKAWDLDEQATDSGDPLFYRHVFPRVKARLGDFTLEHQILSVPIIGKAGANSQYGTGPAADIPRAITNCYASYLDADIPSALCGAQALAS